MTTSPGLPAARACRSMRAMVLACLCASAPALASSTPNAYTYYAFPAGTPALYDVTYAVTVTQDPGHAANVFWSSQFGFSSGHGAYIGMQSNGGPRRTFLFSVWDATEAVAGDAGSYCVNFSGEGVGKSCHTQAIDWQQGHTYRFRVASEGNHWFGATITDLTTQHVYKLGSIRVGSDTINPGGMINWVEYFEWSDPTASCFNQPFSRATFAVPKGNGGTISAAITSTKASTGDCYSTDTAIPRGSVAREAVGNSVRGPIVGIAGKVVDVKGGLTAGAQAILYHATGGTNQQWVRGHDSTIRARAGLCLDTLGTTAGAQVVAATCNGSSSQLWHVSGTAIVQTRSSLCLQAPPGQTADVTPLDLGVCAGTANQQWQPPIVPTP